MDAALLQQYRYLLALIGAGLLVGLFAAALAGRASAGSPAEPASADPESAGPAPTSLAMLLLVALAAGAGALLLLPAVLIIPFFGTWQVRIALLTAAAFLAAPLLYAWRTRPF